VKLLVRWVAPCQTHHVRNSEQLLEIGATATCPHCGSRRVVQPMSRVASVGKSKSYAKTMRAAAARERHTSNFGRSER
jgi:DNA-directed RNA polymerase subunit RPC12/RpoP